VGVAVFPDCENTPILDGAFEAVVGVSRRLAILLGRDLVSLVSDNDGAKEGYK